MAITISKTFCIILSGIHIFEQHTNTNRKNQNPRHPIKFQLQSLMAHSDTKVKIYYDIEPPCYRPFQKANTSHSCLPRDTLKAGALPGFNPKYQTKRKTTFCLNNIMWFIYFTNYIITSRPSVLQSHDRWPILSLYTTNIFFLNPLYSNTQTF